MTSFPTATRKNIISLYDFQRNKELEYEVETSAVKEYREKNENRWDKARMSRSSAIKAKSSCVEWFTHSARCNFVHRRYFNNHGFEV